MSIANVRAITIDQLPNILHYAREEKMSVYIIGEPGCGKSETVKMFAYDYCDNHIIDFRLNTVLPIDIRGSAIPNMAEGLTEFLPPSFLPGTKRNPAEKGVFFIDEADRAPQENLSAIMSIILDREMGDVKIPDGWLIVLAGNGAEFSNNTTVLDPAVAERLIVVKIKTSVKKSIAWGERTKRYHPYVCAFLDTDPASFSGGESRRDSENICDSSARQWERVSKACYQRDATLAAQAAGKTQKLKVPTLESIANENDGPEFTEDGKIVLSLTQFTAVIDGKIGMEKASKFLTFISDVNQKVRFKEIFDEPNREKRFKLLPRTKKGLYYLSYGMIHHIEDLESAILAMEIVNDIHKIQPEDGETFPVVELKTSAAERVFTKVVKGLKLTAKFGVTPAYKEYIVWRESIPQALRDAMAQEDDAPDIDLTKAA